MQFDQKAVDALAEAWASIDGKLIPYCAEAGMSASTVTRLGLSGHYLGYQAEAEEMIRRLRARGFDIVPVAAPLKKEPPPPPPPERYWTLWA